MSTEERAQSEEKPQTEPQDEQMHDAPAPPTGPAAMSTGNRKRPRLDLNMDPRERKRGKTVFGLLLGTLNKAKNEDKERNASDAAKKRQLIEQRLQDKLKKETDSVRRAEEAKKDKTSASRKEEDLQLKDSIQKLRRTRLPTLAHFLSTADKITSDDSSPPLSSSDPLTPQPRTHPPPLYYLPAILTPAQEAHLTQRKAEAKEAAEKEWEAFHAERVIGIDEIKKLRERVAEEEGRKKGNLLETSEGAEEQDVQMGEEIRTDSQITNGTQSRKEEKPVSSGVTSETAVQRLQGNGAQMEVDDDAEPSTSPETSNSQAQAQPDVKEKAQPAPLVQASTADEDDAVEY